MTMKPLADRVLIKVEKEEEKTVAGRRSRKGQGRCMRRRQVLPERHTRSHGSQGWRYRSDQPQCRSDRQAGRRGTDTGTLERDSGHHRISDPTRTILQQRKGVLTYGKGY